MDDFIPRVNIVFCYIILYKLNKILKKNQQHTFRHQQKYKAAKNGLRFL